MLLKLRNSLNDSKFVSRVIVSILIFLFVVPNLIGFFAATDSPLNNSPVVGRSAHGTVDLKTLHAQFPNEVNQAIAYYETHPDAATYVFNSLLKSLSLRDFIKQHELLPPAGFMLEKIRSSIYQQLKRNYESNEENESPFEISDEELHYHMIKAMPANPLERNAFLQNIQYQYALDQLSNSLFAFAEPSKDPYRYKDPYLEMRQPIAQYTLPVEKFRSQVDSSDLHELQEYFDLNQEKYYTDATYSFTYQNLNHGAQELISLYGAENLREELLEYETESPSDEDLVDLAHIKLFEQLKDFYEYKNTDFLKKDFEQRFKSFTADYLTEKKELNVVDEAQSKSVFGPEISSVLRDYESEGADGEQYYVLNYGDKISILTVTAYKPTALMSFEEALSDLKQDYIQYKALEIAKETAETIVQHFDSASMPDNIPSEAHFNLSEYSISLRDKVIAQLHQLKGHDLYPDFDYRNAVTLTHPSLDYEQSYKIVYQPLENAYKLLVLLPSSKSLNRLQGTHSVVDNEKYGLENIDELVVKWVDKAYTMYFINSFHHLIDESFHYELDSDFLDELSAYHQES